MSVNEFITLDAENSLMQVHASLKVSKKLLSQSVLNLPISPQTIK